MLPQPNDDWQESVTFPMTGIVIHWYWIWVSQRTCCFVLPNLPPPHKGVWSINNACWNRQHALSRNFPLNPTGCRSRCDSYREETNRSWCLPGSLSDLRRSSSHSNLPGGFYGKFLVCACCLF